jgi:RNA polymerase sigma-70 factor (ECF subfamily)
MGTGATVPREWAERSEVTNTARPAGAALEFEQIYRRYFEDVRRWVRALGGPDAEREDLVQDVFIVVHRRLPDFDGENLPGWLYQIARHRVRDYRRLRWVRIFTGKAQVDDAYASPADGPETLLQRKEKERLLARLVDKLPEAQRVAFVLFEVEGYSGEEIARLQGASINTVWARVHKARAKLAADLKRTRGIR